MKDFEDLVEFNRALEIASCNTNVKGCLETFIIVLGRALHLGIALRHHEENKEIQFEGDSINQLR